jgi:hypothetical protein
MANKSQRGKQKAKSLSNKKKKSKDRKKVEKIYGSTMSSARGQKKEINPKRHKGKHTKGTRKKK